MNRYFRFLLSALGLWMCLHFDASAQYFTVSGTVWDEQMKYPVDFASVQVEGENMGVYTNMEGRFSLKIPEAYFNAGKFLKFSHLGYETLRLPLKTKILKDTIFKMANPGVELEEVKMDADALGPKELLEAAFDKVKDNYPTEPFLQRGFYRHYCKDQGKFGRLIEAAVEIMDNRGYTRLYPEPERRMDMRVTQLRRSYDFTRFFTYDHAAISLSSVLRSDLLAIQSFVTGHRRSLKSANDMLEFEFKPSAYFDGRLVQVVGFKWEHKSPVIPSDSTILEYLEDRNYRGGSLIEGEFLIDSKTLAILGVNHHTHLSMWNIQPPLYFSSRRNMRMMFREFEGKYFPSFYSHEGSDSTWYKRPGRTDSLGHEHRYHIDFQINEAITEGVEAFEGKEPGRLDLMEVNYDPGFWDTYNVLQATPLEDSLIKDLERRIPLETQFRTFNEREQRIELDSTVTEHFHTVLKNSATKYILVEFWDWASIVDKDPKKFAKRAKKLQKKGIRVWLVGLDIDEADFLRGKERWYPTKGYVWVKGEKTGATLIPRHFRTGFGIGSKIPQEYEIEAAGTARLFIPGGNYVTEIQPSLNEKGTDKKIWRMVKILKKQQ